MKNLYQEKKKQEKGMYVVMVATRFEDLGLRFGDSFPACVFFFFL